MASVDLEITLTCDQCGNELDAADDKRGGLAVTPCPSCIDNAKVDAEEEGYERGHAQGLAEGRSEDE